MSTKKAKKLGLYIHLPFCKTICAYCAFPAFANKSARIREYLRALTREIAAKGRMYGESFLVDTIYFGGGTPSLLEPEQLGQILKSIYAAFPRVKIREISMEANPESLTAEKISAHSKIGITRLSIGIQCLDDRALWKIARPHKRETALQVLTMLRNTGWKNFGCDLIIGLPWQTLASFKKDLHTLVKFHPSHFSTYFLSYDTPKIDSFNKDIPGEEEQIAMYTYADRYLSQKGYLHYEVSNFALPGFECQHNQKYWNRQEYLGLGLGAHSFINEEITENQDKFEPYLSDPLSPKEQFRLEKDLIEADSIMLNLRKSSGIDLNQFSKNFGHVDTQQLLRKAGPLIGSKHLRFFQNNICPTLTGWLILDKITRDLI